MGALELGDRSFLPGRALAVLDIGALGLLLDLDLERAELVVPSRDAAVLPRGGGGAIMCLSCWSMSCAFSSQWATGRSSSKTQGLGLGLKLEFGPARGSPAWHLAGFWL